MKLNYRSIGDDVLENQKYIRESMQKISVDRKEEKDIPRYTDMYKQDKNIITYYSKIAIPEILPEELGGKCNSNTFFETNYDDIPIFDDGPMPRQISEVLSNDEIDPSMIDKFEPNF